MTPQQDERIRIRERRNAFGNSVLAGFGCILLLLAAVFVITLLAAPALQKEKSERTVRSDSR